MQENDEAHVILLSAGVRTEARGRAGVEDSREISLELGHCHGDETVSDGGGSNNTTLLDRKGPDVRETLLMYPHN